MKEQKKDLKKENKKARFSILDKIDYKRKSKENVKYIRHGIYLGYKGVLISYIFFVCLFLVLAYVFLNNAFNVKTSEAYSVVEKVELDYTVNLIDPDNIFDHDYLYKNDYDNKVGFVSDFIGTIDFDYDYVFNANDVTSAKFVYSVDADLVIWNSDFSEIWLVKNYKLLVPQYDVLDNYLKKNFSNHISIDYNYYERIAQTLNSKFNGSCKLIINYNVEKEIDGEKNIKKSTVSIPLLEDKVRFVEDGFNTKVYSKDAHDGGLVLDNNIICYLGVFYLILSSVLLVKFFSLLKEGKPKASAYDEMVNNLLKTHDKDIVEVNTLPTFSEYEVYKVTEFKELVDLHKNLNLPIMYYNVTSHVKCHLYVKNNSELYLLTIKAVDLENKK